MLQMRSSIYLLTYLVAVTQSAKDTTNNVDCDCYLTNGTQPTCYSKYAFFDFRQLGKYAGVPDPIKNATRSSFGSSTSGDYFRSDEWTGSWELQGWNNSKSKGVSSSSDAKVLMVNSPNNVYIQENKKGDDGAASSSSTFLTMRTMRFPKFQSAAEFVSVPSNYRFLSLRMLARTVGSPGACTAMFTYREGDTPDAVQEADLEILTSGPRNKIQYTNQPSFTEENDGDNPEATRNATIPGNLAWDDWLVHRLDWTPERSTWYVAGKEAASVEFQTPKDAAQVLFNTWSDGGSWSGEMKVGDAAYLQIQWIEMVYNTTTVGSSSEKRDNDACEVVCSIDEKDEVGKAKLLWGSSNSASSATGGRMGWIFTCWIMALTMVYC